MSSDYIANLAYCAGIIDGEGCISVSTGSYATVTVSIRMCDRAALDMFARLFGRDVKEESYKTSTGKTVYSWVAHSQNAAVVLRSLLPYLLVKRDRAKIALALIGTARTRERRRQKLAPKEVALRARLADDIRRANNNHATVLTDSQRAVIRHIDLERCISNQRVARCYRELTGK